jgi:shikimate dehydrogenase
MKYAGVIGYPVKHSLSPQMHNAAFEALGIDARYDLWETPPDELAARVASLRAPGIYGANVTIPHKEAIPSLLDEVDPQAARIGAVNTIVNRDGKLIGYNTDAPGFLSALLEGASPGFNLRDKRVVLLGNGGAARGAAFALLECYVDELTIVGRTETHIAALLARLRQNTNDSTVLQGTIFGSREAQRALEQADVLVNTTSVGLKEGDETLLINAELLAPTALVMDMVYNRVQTPLLRAAAERGCMVLNGLSMLLYQGALAFELWTGRDAPLDTMRAALIQ